MHIVGADFYHKIAEDLQLSFKFSGLIMELCKVSRLWVELLMLRSMLPSSSCLTNIEVNQIVMKKAFSSNS